MTQEKKLNKLQSVILLVFIIFAVAVCILLKTGGPMIGLFLSWIIIYLFCKILRIEFGRIIGGAYEAIRVVVPTVCLLMAIGVMIGTWLQSGTIATIIVGGLRLIDPTWLLPLTLLFCAVLSLVTGTSYGSVGSAGVAMMAIGNAMGINPGMVAGAVICGSMFGDKISPLSDTTNLAPAVAGAKLGDHVRSMLWTTLPPFLISLILFTVLGIRQTSGDYSAGDLNLYIEALNGEFQLGLVTLIPAVLIIVLLLLKVDAIVALGISAVAAGAVSVFWPRRNEQHAAVCGDHLFCGGHGRHAGEAGRAGKYSGNDREPYPQRRHADSCHPSGGLCGQPDQLFSAHGARADRTSDGAAVQRQKDSAGNPFQMPGGCGNARRPHDPLARVLRLHVGNPGRGLGGLFPVSVFTVPDAVLQRILRIYRHIR